MRKLIALAGVLGTALTLMAAPAFTADSGNLVVSITAEPPPAPCLTVSPATIDFGTRAFSTPALRGDAYSATRVRVANCGTASENVAAVGTDASGPSGDWTLGHWATDAPPAGNPCVNRPNLYFLGTNGSSGDVVLQRDTITKTSGLLTQPGGDPGVWNPGAAADIQMYLIMPCQGSNGAGEAKTLSATFTAIVA
jgi:hypothetical protein